jgi:hypothetical protein
MIKAELQKYTYETHFDLINSILYKYIIFRFHLTLP